MYEFILSIYTGQWVWSLVGFTVFLASLTAGAQRQKHHI